MNQKIPPHTRRFLKVLSLLFPRLEAITIIQNKPVFDGKRKNAEAVCTSWVDKDRYGSLMDGLDMYNMANMSMDEFVSMPFVPLTDDKPSGYSQNSAIECPMCTACAVVSGCTCPEPEMISDLLTLISVGMRDLQGGSPSTWPDPFINAKYRKPSEILDTLVQWFTSHSQTDERMEMHCKEIMWHNLHPMIQFAEQHIQHFADGYGPRQHVIPASGFVTVDRSDDIYHLSLQNMLWLWAARIAMELWKRPMFVRVTMKHSHERLNELCVHAIGTAQDLCEDTARSHAAELCRAELQRINECFAYTDNMCSDSPYHLEWIWSKSSSWQTINGNFIGGSECYTSRIGCGLSVAHFSDLFRHYVFDIPMTRGAGVVHKPAQLMYNDKSLADPALDLQFINPYESQGKYQNVYDARKRVMSASKHLPARFLYEIWEPEVFS